MARAARRHGRAQLFRLDVCCYRANNVPASCVYENGLDLPVIEKVLAAQRAQLVTRNRLAQRILGLRASGFPQGLHRWLPLPAGCDERALLSEALAS